MKRVITIISIVLLFVTVPVVVFFVKKQQDIRSQAAPATTLYFTPSTITKQQGDTFSLNVMMDSGTNNITMADFSINSDSEKVKITGITQGTFLSQVVVAGRTTDSKATMVLKAPDAQPAKGVGVLASVTFEVVADTGTSQITLTGSKAVAIDETVNVITGTTPATVTIGSAATPTPTATPTVPPTATPTEEDQNTQTPTPTDSDESTPTPTQEASGGTTDINLALTSPKSEGIVTTSMPTFEGTAPAGSTVTITIYSDPITVTTIADESGAWVYTLDQSLAEGQHRVVIAAEGTNGATETTSNTFYVQTEPIPVTGPSTATLILSTVIAGLFILLGFAF